MDNENNVDENFDNFTCSYCHYIDCECSRLEYNKDNNNIVKEQITIQTHDKKFHADDVGSISLLTSYYSQKNMNINIIRSRNQSLFETSDILVDVGFEYDPDNGRYDHHQNNYNEIFKENCIIPLSSIGMIWKHYGKELLLMYIDTIKDIIPKEINNNHEHITNIHNKVYFKIIQEIDAHVNGISSIKGGEIIFQENLHLSSIISSYNHTDVNNDEKQIQSFGRAVDFFGQIFEIKLNEIIRKYFDTILSNSLLNKIIEKIPSNQEYIIINVNIPGIFKCLNKLDPEYRFKFIIFNNCNEITIKTRTRKEDIFTPIVPLMKQDKLYEILGNKIDIGKSKTLDTAVKIVTLSLIVKNKTETIKSSYLKFSKYGLYTIVLGSLLLGRILYKSLEN